MPVVPLRPGARLAPGAMIPAAELEALMDGMVDRAMREEHIVGVSVSVVQNGTVLMNKGYGYASLSPARKVDPERTMFRLASVSKTFTWLLALKTVESGQMRLNTPINQYLPEKLWIRDQGFSQQITLEHLMGHSAGFDDTAAGHLFERDPARVRPLATYLESERPRRVRPPGLMSTYSNFGAGLAGEAVSNVLGQPFEQLAENQIFLPLGMSHTSFREVRPVTPQLPAPLPAGLAYNLSTGFADTPTGPVAKPFEYVGQVAPAGSASSTSRDMAQYMMMLLNNGSLGEVQIFGPATAARLHQTHFRSAPGADGFNYGFMNYRLPGGFKGIGHGGATLNFLSNMVLVPDLNLGIFITTNTNTGYDLTVAVPNEVVERFFAAPASSPPALDPGLYAQRAVYEGRYRGTRRASQGLEAFVMGLQSDLAIKISPDGVMTVTGAQGVRRYTRVDGSNGVAFRSLEGPDQMVFVIERGRATRMVPPLGIQTFLRANAMSSPGLLLGSTVLALISALAVLGGLMMRAMKPGYRQSDLQAAANGAQTLQAVLILVAVASFAVWGRVSGNPEGVIFNWPGVQLLTASACLLVAALLEVLVIGLLPLAWRSERRVDSWTTWRKLRFTLATVVFGVFLGLLASRGALLPWS